MNELAPLQRADLDEMLFEQRERRYGAYALRRRYPAALAFSTLAVSLAALLLAFGPMLAAKETQQIPRPKLLDISLISEKTPDPETDMIHPPPPPPLPPPPRSLAFQIPLPEPDAEEHASVAEMDSLHEAPMIALETREGGEPGPFTGEADGTGEIPELIVEAEPDPGTFLLPEEEPVPVNLEEVRKLIGYPLIAQQGHISGLVVLRVLVDKQGRCKRHLVMRSAHPLLDQAVAAQVPKLRFTPAIQGGRPVEFWVNIPFKFEMVD
jgi:protein TonB